MATTAPPANRPTDPYGPRERHNEGQGRRLTAAFEALETFPVLAAARERIVRLFSDGEPGRAELVSAVEGDLALTLAVLRVAGRGVRSGHSQADGIVRALELVPPADVLAIAHGARTYDFFERTGVWQNTPERFRLHGGATQRMAERIALEAAGATHDSRAHDRLMVSAMLHDIGKLVLLHAYPGYPEQVHGDARTPEERVQRERRELGIDHALVGGVVARRWGLPPAIAQAIESHHSATADGEAAIIRLADMLAHYLVSGPVTPAELLAAGRAAGLSPVQLRQVIYEIPQPGRPDRPRQVHPCPLSAREVDVLKGLSRGMVYKQIASELGLSTSTVRTHLHNIYGKLGAMDRAQAVLIATERGWI